MRYVSQRRLSQLRSICATIKESNMVQVKPIKDSEKKVEYMKLKKAELVKRLITAENYVAGQDILIQLGNIFKVSKPDD